jgi:hypothetical protein
MGRALLKILAPFNPHLYFAFGRLSAIFSPEKQL